jgi:hypothetical protein
MASTDPLLISAERVRPSELTVLAESDQDEIQPVRQKLTETRLTRIQHPNFHGKLLKMWTGTTQSLLRAAPQSRFHVGRMRISLI